MGTTTAVREDDRLAALAAYDILDSAAEEPFERITDLIRAILGVPIALVSFVDRDRQWFKARRGIAACETDRSVAICDHTIRSFDPLVIPDTARDPRFRDNPLVTGQPHVASYLGIPLVTPDGHALGSLCAIDPVPRIFSPDQIEVMKKLAALVIDWLEMRRVAHSDFLTGILTRRAFLAEMEREIARFQRHRRPCGLAVFDIDHFKSINDTHGHAAGDAVLRAVTGACQSVLRVGDLFGRLGGEEFGLLLPETDAAEALAAAERFREAIEGMALPAHLSIRVTASFGVAPIPQDCQGPEQWLSLADNELYRAKQAGRNRSSLGLARPQ